MIEVGRDFERMQDYIGGRLSDDEHRAFEDRLIRDPGLVREFEQSLRLSEGLRALRAQGYVGKLASRHHRFQVWRPTLAAAAIAGLALFLWVQRTSEPSPILTASLESRASGAAAHFTFVAMRESSRPDLDLPSSGIIEFRAAPTERITASRYQMTLVREDGGSAKPVATVAGLVLGADGYVHGYADASRLGAGSYMLRVQADAATAGSGAEFVFNLRTRGAASAR